jgi:hypothetical protein
MKQWLVNVRAESYDLQVKRERMWGLGLGGGGEDG